MIDSEFYLTEDEKKHQTTDAYKAEMIKAAEKENEIQDMLLSIET